MNENDETLRIPRYPEVWPGWETVDKLGSGSFGAVYKIQRRSGSFTEYAAVKCISIPKDPDEVDKLRKSGYDIDSITEMFLEQSRQFEQEYRLMAVLKGNTNIVDCDDLRSVRRSDTLGFALFIKMELLTPLDDMEFSRFTEPEIIRLGRDLCKALELCEQHKIIHRDIKPANIFVSDNGDYKLGDFGVSRIMEHTNTEGTVTGTPRFMAPEVYGNRSYNHTVDIYSLGLVLYWLLNEQRTPFQPLPPAKLSYSGNQEALNRRMKGDPIPEPKNGSAALKAVVLKAVRYESSERYQTAEEMRRAIGDVERKAREEEERKKKEEAERRAREEAERKAKEEAERRAREEAERKAKEEAKRKAREEAKQKAKEEAERKAAEKAQRRVERKAEPKPPHLKKLLLLLLALLVIPGTIFFPREKGMAAAEEKAISETVDPTTELTAEPAPEPNVACTYVENDSGITVTGYRGKLPADMILPGEIDGKKVTSIGDHAFEDCDSLTSVTIPDSVTSIDYRAFSDCKSLTSVTIPDSVTSIGSGTFWNCDSLTSVTIPDSVTSIGDGAFAFCGSLTSVTIPDSVTSIGDGVFGACSGLKNISVKTGNRLYSSQDGILFDKAKTTLVCWPAGRSGSYEIPKGVTSIGDEAFLDCYSLTSVTIPDSVTSIGDGAFGYCGSLTGVTIPDSVTSIGDGAFGACSGLKNISVKTGNRLYSSQDGILFDKAKTTLVCWPAGRSGSYEIPKGVTSIGDLAFWDCGSLTSVTIPDSVTSIGDGAFGACSGLKNISVKTGNRLYSSQDGILFDKAKTTLVCWPAGRSGSYEIPKGVTSIGDHAFGYCGSLTSVTIPDSVTSIGSLAFDGCKKLRSVTIPANCEVGGNAFPSTCTVTRR